MFNNKNKKIVDSLNAPECLEPVGVSCNELTVTPEIGYGELPVLCQIEKYFNIFVSKLPIIGAICLFIICVLIIRDVVGRTFFNSPFNGITDLESLAIICIGFSGMAYAIVCRQSIQIDLLFLRFTPQTQRRLYLFVMLLAMTIAIIIGWRATLAGLHWTKTTPTLKFPESYFVIITGLSLLLCGVAFFFQVIHSIKQHIVIKDYCGIFVAFNLAILIFSLPFLYKYFDITIPHLVLGALGFLLLMLLMLLRMPLGWAMGLVGLLGLFLFVRRPEAALHTIGAIPFVNTSSFIYIAFPMFMLMGEMAFHSGLSEDLFDAANKWLGRLPGGLAVATVGGCAGFGAVCGDSMATVITMSSVALEPMKQNKYDLSLATGSLAAGGTLGILIPPSMGFIIYSMLTEESIGKLFIAGILPGILLTVIFMAIIIFQVIRHPEYAMKSKHYQIGEKLLSLVKLIPILVLFYVVVGGILYGFFTPGEGGAVGAILALIYGIFRKKITFALFIECFIKTASMFGKLFILFVGVNVFGTFLSTSRLPTLLADFIIHMQVNAYIVLFTIILLYIILGCVMNIMPMMMLTLPSLFPTIQALGFDGIWFGVITVIVMEMGMITPPVGMNVFTLASLAPDIPMSTIFKGVLPFFFGMILCVILLIIFPDIVFILPNLMQ